MTSFLPCGHILKVRKVQWEPYLYEDFSICQHAVLIGKGFAEVIKCSHALPEIRNVVNLKSCCALSKKVNAWLTWDCRFTCWLLPMFSLAGRRHWTEEQIRWLLKKKSSSADGTPGIKTTSVIAKCNHAIIIKVASCIHTWATEIHFSMIFALCAGQDEEPGGDVAGAGHNSEAITQFVMALNWEMVARTVGARSRFSFLSLWDQMQPRQWNGTTLTKSSWEINGTRKGSYHVEYTIKATWKKWRFTKLVTSQKEAWHLQHPTMWADLQCLVQETPEHSPSPLRPLRSPLPWASLHRPHNLMMRKHPSAYLFMQKY